MITEIEIQSAGRGVYDITPYVEQAIKSAGLKKGVVLLYSTDPLARLITIEYDVDLIEDILTLVNSWKVKDPHVIASVFQPSLIIPVEEGLLLGSFQQICLLDLNEKEGTRKLVIEVMQ
ncbi:MAG: YjbQ family protein [Thermofilaceae archaeon]